MKSAHPFALLFPSNRNSPSILGPSRTYSACADSLHHQRHIHMASRLRELSGISTSKPRWPKNPGKIQGSMPTKRYSIHSRKSGSQAFFRKVPRIDTLRQWKAKKITKCCGLRALDETCSYGDDGDAHPLQLKGNIRNRLNFC